MNVNDKRAWHLLLNFAMLPQKEQERFLSEIGKDPSNNLLVQRLMKQIKERAAYEVDPDKPSVGRMPIMGSPDKKPEFDLYQQ